MSSTEPTPALTPHQSARAAWALRHAVEDDLQRVLEELLDEHFAGDHPMALADAAEALRRVRLNLDALRALGPPISVAELLLEEPPEAAV